MQGKDLANRPSPQAQSQCFFFLFGSLSLRNIFPHLLILSFSFILKYEARKILIENGGNWRKVLTGGHTIGLLNGTHSFLGRLDANTCKSFLLRKSAFPGKSFPVPCPFDINLTVNVLDLNEKENWEPHVSENRFILNFPIFRLDPHPCLSYVWCLCVQKLSCSLFQTMHLFCASTGSDDYLDVQGSGIHLGWEGSNCFF